ncbi:hypothetical protein KP509_33G014100 [Ceratopteris richardii]|uniref:Glutathione peroxidase n=1 Tax=Ceratopteris richardii TaxID=49495 RepID=A0A8T2QNI8_CERRI|nr:hypothetical protein KP509_33G014100 [Ceratopteris richardii]
MALCMATSYTSCVNSLRETARNPLFHRSSQLPSYVSVASTSSDFTRGSYCCIPCQPYSNALEVTRVTGLNVYAAQSIYDFTVKDIDRKDVNLSKYKGKVLLVVNVASRCGLTTSNYTDLARLYKKLKGENFEILAFPCNQFAGQEPGTNQQIKEFACSRFKAEYPIFDKVDVNGFNTAPVYKFLKTGKSTGLFGSSFAENIKWNFTKFLVDKNGQVYKRYEPSTSPLAIEKDIRNLLKA